MAFIELDSLDESIIAALKNDGRATTKSLGKQFGVAHTTIASRIQRMRDLQVMHVRAVTDAKAYGFNELAIIGFQIRGSSQEVAQQIRKTCPDIVVYVASGTLGRFDLIVVLLATNVTELQKYVDEEISKLGSIVSSEVWLSVEVLKFVTEWALLNQSGHSLPPNPAIEDERQIMELFYEDGRMSYSQASRILGYTEVQIRNKVNRLVKEKLLHFSAVKDPQTIGPPLMALIFMKVELKHARSISERLSSREEFAFVGRFIGRFEIIGLVTLQDVSALFKLVNSELRQLKGMIRTETMQIVENYHQEPRWVRIL
ncbi:Lrp/AsnC family transcriptional regulator [Spongiibacter sp. KMU-166]|uniref:Lrp/AsnC family transcriptional regulator n=1 Tax=Spongiibacter thalassae TaxID=2721624 RepID=A0ABX1G9I5_9GAMM|nr:Lrp/AsnC family transcriptional regulator [Spongiibacter thalassae]NKI15820.1 Lrp/AsnC family transcriptional regulator [Spongiibacter thalassae]